MKRSTRTTLLLGPTLVLAVGLLSGCTDSSGAFPSSFPSTAAPSATATPTTDAGRVALAYEQFLNGLYSLDSNQQKELALLAQQYPQQADFAKLSDAKQANVVAEVKKIDPALDVLDVSSLDAPQKFLTYSTLLYLGSTGSPTANEDSAPRIDVKSSAVKVSGSKASVPLSALTFTLPGDAPAPYPTNAPIVAQSMPFEKVGAKWLIDGSALAQQGAQPTPSPTASGK